MRNYLPNSPEAAARIVALVLISDGNVCQSEIDTLRQLEIEQNLGLAPGAFANVVKDLCEDLLMGAPSLPTNDQLRELSLRVLPKD